MYQPDSGGTVNTLDFVYHTEPHDKADVMIALATVKGSFHTNLTR